MRDIGYALCGAILGGGAVFVLSYSMSYWLFLPVDNGSAFVYHFCACGFDFIGAMLGALGGLAVERRTRGPDEQDQPPPK